MRGQILATTSALPVNEIPMLLCPEHSLNIVAYQKPNGRLNWQTRKCHCYLPARLLFEGKMLQGALSLQNKPTCWPTSCDDLCADCHSKPYEALPFSAPNKVTGCVFRTSRSQVVTDYPVVLESSPIRWHLTLTRLSSVSDEAAT